MQATRGSSRHTWAASGSSDIYIVVTSEREGNLRFDCHVADLACRCPKHVLHPAVSRARIDACYLDTTYLNPKYCFPPQPQVIEACAALARKNALGLPDTAPPIPDRKLDIRVDLGVDVKPDPSPVAEMGEERSKAIMQSWLVKQGEGVKEELLELKNVKPKRTLIVMGTYSIGKERIVKGEMT